MEQIFDAVVKAETKVLREAAKAAARAAGQEIAVAARALVRTQQGILNATRKRTGGLETAIDTKEVFFDASGIAVSVVGPRRGITINTGRVRKRGKRKGLPVLHVPSKIAHLVDRGSRHARAFPFLEPAAASAQSRAEEAAGAAAHAKLMEGFSG